MANLVTVAVGSGGRVCLFRYRRVDLVGDIAGWFGTGTDGARFTGLAPVRLLDTRDGNGRGGAVGLLGPGGVVAVPVAGRCRRPGTSAVVVNLVVTEPTAPGYLAA